MYWRMAYPKVSNANLNVRELTKKFEVNATVKQEPVSSCGRKKPVENKVNVHRTHAFRLKSQDGENGALVYPPKNAYAFGKRVRKVEDNKSVKSIVEKFDCTHVVPTPEKIFKDGYSSVVKKSPSYDFDGRIAVSPKTNTLRKTVSNFARSTNCSNSAPGEDVQLDVGTPQLKHGPLQELVDKQNTNNNNINTSELTNSLKVALRSPLPKGPPPKKPPRTFAHNQDYEKDRDATMLESHRKLVKLKEIVEGSQQNGGDVVLRAKSPALQTMGTREQATSISGGKPAQPGDTKRGRLVPSTLGLGPGKLAVFRLCTACLSGSTTMRRGDYQELAQDKVVPEEHIYDVPFQSIAKPSTPQLSSKECHFCKEKGLHYLCSDIVHNVNSTRVSPVGGQKSLAEPR